MLVPEAQWYRRRIDALGDALYPMLNVGCQTRAFRTEVQPWIDERLFAPARARGRIVVHSDIQSGEGVDLAGDVLDAPFAARLAGMGFASALCSNLLEHVMDPVAMGRVLAGIVRPGGHILVSAPHRFPYHPDPIDTMFRPSPRELAAIFPRTEIVDETIIKGGTIATYALERVRAGPMRFVRDVARRRDERVGPVRASPAPSRLRFLPWLVRRLEISCVVLRRSS